MKYSFALARDTDITSEQLERICDNANVSRNLLSRVGDDYFEAEFSEKDLYIFWSLEKSFCLIILVPVLPIVSSEDIKKMSC